MKFKKISDFHDFGPKNTNKPLGILVFSPSGEKVDFFKIFHKFLKKIEKSHIFHIFLKFYDFFRKSLEFWCKNPMNSLLFSLVLARGGGNGEKRWKLMKFTKIHQIIGNFIKLPIIWWKKQFLRPGLKTTVIHRLFTR